MDSATDRNPKNDKRLAQIVNKIIILQGREAGTKIVIAIVAMIVVQIRRTTIVRVAAIEPVTASLSKLLPQHTPTIAIAGCR